MGKNCFQNLLVTNMLKVLNLKSAYRGDFGETKYMFFLIKNDELLENYNKIWEKVENSIKK